MTLACGVDLIEIARVAQAAERHGERFYRRFFTPAEQSACQGRPARLAGRVAVKEAVAKALGTGIGDFNWTDIEVLGDERGKPELALHNRARQVADACGLSEWSISLAHTATHAIGLAVASGGGDRPMNLAESAGLAAG
ncbi:MAG: holo-ACP synthase [Candidatus Promineifilaceae bacterium]